MCVAAARWPCPDKLEKFSLDIYLYDKFSAKSRLEKGRFNIARLYIFIYIFNEDQTMVTCKDVLVAKM